MSDIFKDMQANVGCDYISNLPSYKRKVWHEMKRLPLTNYDIKQLEDFSKYVFGMSYQSLKDVAYYYIDELQALGDIPPSLQNYIDYEAFGRDLDISGCFIETSRGICEIPY